jgi:hypothetical protein
MQQHERSFSQGQPVQNYSNGAGGPGGPGGSMGRMGDRLGSMGMGPPPPKGPPSGHGAYSTVAISSAGPPQLSSLPFQNSQNPPPMFPQNQGAPAQSSYAQSPVTASATKLPPLKPVFGLSLEQLFERDGSAVPMIVYQCIQAVDLFGLEVEGIYRLSGTSSHITSIKAMFDNGMVAGLLDKFYLSLTPIRCVKDRFSRSGKFPPRRK